MKDKTTYLGTLAAFGTGAATMYFLDPARGARRRAIIADKIASALRKLPRAIRVTKQDVANRTYGIFAETKNRLFADDASDEVIEARVRSKMGRVVSHPHAIKVVCENGNITLSGPILADEVKKLLKCTAAVSGVQSVDNRLDEHDSPEGISALQGGRNREPRTEFLQENWSPTARLMAGTAGTAALAYGLLKRDAVSISLATIGAAVLARSASNIEFQRLFGYGGGRRAVDIQKTINVDAPVDVVFSLWADLDNFPRLMSNVVEVDLNDSGDSHWKVKGPAGSIVEWDAELTVFEEERRIAWKSLPRAEIENAGIVKFIPNKDGTTEVNVRLSYNPPAGAIGHGAATIFGSDPKTQMDEDLMRMKSFLESRQLPHDAAESGRSDAVR